jgi:hypothetical protein
MADAVRGGAAAGEAARPRNDTGLREEVASLRERLGAVESELRTLTESVSSLLTYLESLPRGPDGSPER